MKTVEDLDEIIKFEIKAFNAQKIKAAKDPSFQKDEHFALDLEINDNEKLLKNSAAKEMIGCLPQLFVFLVAGRVAAIFVIQIF